MVIYEYQKKGLIEKVKAERRIIYMKRLFQLRKVLCTVILCINLVACGNNENAYFEGQYLYMGDEKYVEATGLYEETNTVIGHTNDDYTIYEVNGDNEHNYIVVRSFLDQKLYVREDYIKDRTIIDGICFNQSTLEYIYEQDFIDIFSAELLECNEIVAMDDDSLILYRRDGIDIYIKYNNDNVGEYCGSIIFNGTEYMYFNAQNTNTVLISEKMKKVLAEFEVLK
jgi:hypothetical protein